MVGGSNLDKLAGRIIKMQNGGLTKPKPSAFASQKDLDFIRFVKLGGTDINNLSDSDVREFQKLSKRLKNVKIGDVS